MKVIKGIEKVAAFRRPSCLTIGTFDGVHIGHQAVIKKVIEMANRTASRSLVMSFDPHPRGSLRQGNSPPLLTSTPHKLNLLKKLGIDLCLLVELDDELANTSPTDFVVNIIHKKLRAAGVVVGARLRFGRGRKGTPFLLKKLGKRLAFQVEVLDEVFVGSLPVSSTAVRAAVLQGLLATAQSLLGRPYSIYGRVVRGKTIGRQLGFRTANIKPLDQVIPPLGVYTVEVIVNGEKYPGALNIGWRPTFSPREPSSPVLEVHILDFDSPIYRKQVEIVFHHRIRDEHFFASPSQLASQITLDIREVRQYFHERGDRHSGRTTAVVNIPSPKSKNLD